MECEKTRVIGWSCEKRPLVKAKKEYDSCRRFDALTALPSISLIPSQ
ncbi:MAG: hypothetical protein IJX09_01540 [Clostridia bacterium]|nr:hypothetical protein [Clostridia bacterium]